MGTDTVLAEQLDVLWDNSCKSISTACQQISWNGRKTRMYKELMSWYCVDVLLLVSLFHGSLNCFIWKASPARSRPLLFKPHWPRVQWLGVADPPTEQSSGTPYVPCTACAQRFAEWGLLSAPQHTSAFRALWFKFNECLHSPKMLKRNVCR